MLHKLKLDLVQHPDIYLLCGQSRGRTTQVIFRPMYLVMVLLADRALVAICQPGGSP